ncbi:septation protein A [Dongia deserti]|uniref:septation protein A n=1 Tax=Dongia deserti TaxID=2268030 RepID=UPI000E656340|nr:septation protein A [Dongia deserti]
MKDTQYPWIKHLVDWGPLIAFFVTFKIGGLMQATAVLIVVTGVLTGLGYFLTRKIQPMPLVTLVVVGIFGGLTLWLQDETFIKMKPTIILGLFAAALVGGLAIGKPPLKFLMGSALELDEAGWRKLTLRFALFFAATAVLNEIIWRTQSTDLWVDFKVFGILVLNVLFMLTQIPLIKRHQLNSPAE